MSSATNTNSAIRDVILSSARFSSGVGLRQWGGVGEGDAVLIAIIDCAYLHPAGSCRCPADLRPLSRLGNPRRIFVLLRRL